MQKDVSDEYVFIDESSTHLGFTPTRARAPRGQRVVVQMPRNRGENITLIAALTSTCLTAAFTFEGGLDLLALEVYVNQVLIPELPTGRTIIWDRLSSHQNARIVGLLETAGHRVMALPGYSPDLNPIEEASMPVRCVLGTRSFLESESVFTFLGGKNTGCFR